MSLPFDIVDVFTDRAYAGNPLAVVHDAHTLTAGQMQAIAAEFGLSETVFPLSPTTSEATYRLRIFMPTRELPFAGHPSIGAAWVLARNGLIPSGEVVQECGAGLLPVDVDGGGARVTGGPPAIGEELDAALLAAAVGLAPTDVDGAAAPGVAGAGVDFAFLMVRPDAVGRAVCDVPAVRAITQDLTGLVVCAVDPPARDVHLRMFAPELRRGRGPGDRFGGCRARGVPGRSRGWWRRTGRTVSWCTRVRRSAARRPCTPGSAPRVAPRWRRGWAARCSPSRAASSSPCPARRPTRGASRGQTREANVALGAVDAPKAAFAPSGTRVRGGSRRLCAARGACQHRPTRAARPRRGGAHL